MHIVNNLMGTLAVCVCVCVCQQCVPV